jgi:hypothetical protein
MLFGEARVEYSVKRSAQEIVFWLLGILGAIGFALLPYLFHAIPTGIDVLLSDWAVSGWPLVVERSAHAWLSYSVLLMFFFNLVAVVALMMQPHQRRVSTWEQARGITGSPERLDLQFARVVVTAEKFDQPHLVELQQVAP